MKKNEKGIYCQHKPSVSSKTATAGITLVALVVTVIVLLILAGITLIYALGEDSIFKEAQDAKDQTQAGIDQEKEDMGDLVNLIKENKGNGYPKIADIVGKKQEKNTIAEDKNGNRITIPGGFKVVPNSPEGTDASKKVEYTYNGDGTPAVQDGIVIEDEEGNQFVWIPVGEINNKEGDTKGKTTTIQLARYTFNTGSSGDGSIKEKKEDGSLLKTSSSSSDGFLEEDADSTTTKAKNIGEFVSEAKANGGYYLARYEASYKDDTHCYSKVSTGTPRKSSSTALTSGMLWNCITQPDAAEVARSSFSNSFVESDLVNSYGWDTAIVFIQTYSDSDYSMQNSKNTSLANTGVNNDKVCNIYDMASNTLEWTTETFTSSIQPCTERGGFYGNSSVYTASRCITGASNTNDIISFRPLLYVK